MNKLIKNCDIERVVTDPIRSSVLAEKLLKKYNLSEWDYISTELVIIDKVLLKSSCSDYSCVNPDEYGSYIVVADGYIYRKTRAKANKENEYAKITTFKDSYSTISHD